MELLSNVSSEEELLELRNEGKISEAEYNDLLAAMKTSSPDNGEEVSPEINEPRKKQKQGKIAFVMMLTAIILPNILLTPLTVRSAPIYFPFRIDLKSGDYRN